MWVCGWDSAFYCAIAAAGEQNDTVFSLQSLSTVFLSIILQKYEKTGEHKN